MNPIRKGLAIGVILLFIGIAFAPSINANMEKEDLIEFTTEVCGLNGGKQTVKLTQEQADEVEALFDSIREQLNTTESREEAKEIFNNSVVELNKYGLLGGLSVKQTQKLITRGYRDIGIKKIFERASINSKLKRNLFCLIAGNTDYTIFDGFFSKLFLTLSFLFIGVEIFILFWMGANYFSNFLPIGIGQVISLGVQGVQWTYPANGWIFTNGLTGIKKWEGEIIGAIRQGPLDELIGVTGFIGIKIRNFDSNDVFYFGFACRVKVKELD